MPLILPFPALQRPRTARHPGAAAQLDDTIHPARVILLISLWLATACNVPLWRAVMDLPGDHGPQRVVFLLAFMAIVAAGNAAVLALAAWRFALKPVLAAAVLAAAFGCYFMSAYGVVIDTNMLINVLQTDAHEAAALFTWRLPVTVLALSVPPLWWLRRQRVRRLPWGRLALQQLLLVVGALAAAVACLLVVFQPFSSTMRNHTQLRYMINPLNSVYAVGNLAARPFRQDSGPLMPVGADAHLGASYAGQNKPPLLVLVLGETGRSGNFALNGYGRPTTPELSARNDLVTARNAWSCGTSTAASVPCMFSHLGKAAYESRSARYESLIDVLHHAGLAVLWVDNQGGCKGVCDRIGEANTASSNVPGLCPDGECLDQVMLRGIDERIAALPAEQRARGTVVVLHQIGSHGPAYFRRSAPERKAFQPECQSVSLQECSAQQLVNAYDNSIVETDHFVNATIRWLQGRSAEAQTSMIYVADHGESLGENNIYLHGLPYAIAPDVQKHVPWITWLSPAMQQRGGTSTACLQAAMGDRRITHDNYFHSVLGLMDVQTSVYQPQLDVFSSCAGKVRAVAAASSSNGLPRRI
ncbi:MULTISPECIES: phosphoethanolamine--lipid A transferase [unclassified Acidovorax]|uniref:phosphoethanolamine transferase n=1 Tax=unclassified Acidovorax TaxID=2684926 RepID=UPI002883436B|nr:MULTISPECIES: phosphoethanolamine--lipid A transferase [unclassified Acidovorax]